MKRSSPKSDPNADAVFSQVSQAIVPAELSQQHREQLRDRILDRIAADAPPPNTITVRGHSVDWQQAWPRVWVKYLRRDTASNVQMILLRLEPGGVIPAHAHSEEEECLVLEGEIHMGGHCVRQGDFHLAKAGAAHSEITTPTGALLMLRSEIPPAVHSQHT